MDASHLTAASEGNLTSFIVAAYVVTATVGLWMWMRSNQLLKRAEKSLEALEKKL